MRNRIVLALLAIGMLVPSSAVLAADFVMTLDASQEVATPPVVSDGSGFGTMTLVDLGGGQFRWDYTITISEHFNFRNFNSGLDNGGRDVTGFHIHGPNGTRGANAVVVYGVHSPSHDNSGSVSAVLNPDNTTTFTGSWTAADGSTPGNINTASYGPALLAAPLGDVPFYWNVHTATYTGGEIRGQIVKIPEPSALGLLGVALLGLGRFRR